MMDVNVTLTEQELPSLPDDFNWRVFIRLNKDKWRGIKTRILEPDLDLREQMMYLDLFDEVAHLAAVVHRSNLPAEPETQPEPQPQAQQPFSAAELQVALMKALAGAQIDTESASDLMGVTSRIVTQVMEGEGDE